MWLFLAFPTPISFNVQFLASLFVYLPFWCNCDAQFKFSDLIVIRIGIVRPQGPHADPLTNTTKVTNL